MKSVIFTRLLKKYIYLLIPIIICLIVLSTLSVINEANQGKQQLLFQTQLMRERIESEINRIYQSELILLLDPPLEKGFIDNYQNINSYILGKTVKNAYSRLSYISYTSDYVDDAAMVFPSIDRFISIGKYYTMITNAEKKVYDLYLREGSYRFLIWDGENFNMCMAPAYRAGQEPWYMLQVTISERSIRKELDNLDLQGFAVLAGKDYIIGNTDNEHLLDNMNSIYVKVTDKVIKKSGFFTMEGFVAVYSYSDILDSVIFGIARQDTLYGDYALGLMLSLLLSVMCLAASIIFMLQINGIVVKPLRKLIGVFDEVESGNLNPVLEYNGDDEFKIVFHNLGTMLGRLKELIYNSYQQRINLQKTKLRQLQSQIAPHFLYNSFNVLRYVIRNEDMQTAELLTYHLGNYFKYVTYLDMDNASLLEEYDYVKSYLEIQRIRFAERIKIEIDELPLQYCNIRVPRLTLYPLVDNAFKHGMVDVDYIGEVKVTIQVRNGELCISIWDNGCGMEETKLIALRNKIEEGQIDGHFGVTSVHQRLKELYPGTGRVEINSINSYYFEVSIFLPLGDTEISITEEIHVPDTHC